MQPRAVLVFHENGGPQMLVEYIPLSCYMLWLKVQIPAGTNPRPCVKCWNQTQEKGARQGRIGKLIPMGSFDVRQGVHQLRT